MSITGHKFSTYCFNLRFITNIDFTFNTYLFNQSKFLYSIKSVERNEHIFKIKSVQFQVDLKLQININITCNSRID